MTKEKKQEIEKNTAKNNIFDKILMGLSGFTLVALAWHDVLHYVRASYPVNYGLAGIAVGFLIYTLLAPMYRK